MADCLNCKNCIRQEVYDGQWGRFIFDKRCSVGVSVIINGRLNPWNMVCDKFDMGEPQIIYKTEEEKRGYEETYYSRNTQISTKELDIKETENTYKALGIKIRKWNGKYKSFYQLLEEVSKEWNKLNKLKD